MGVKNDCPSFTFDLLSMTTNRNNIETIAPQNNHDLTPGTVFTTASIAHAIVIKDGDVFFLSECDGRVPLDSHHGFGLYYHDCRFLSGYDLKLSGRRPEQLVWTADTGFRAVLGLTNPDIETRNGTRIEKHNIEIKWVRIIDGAKRALYDDIAFRNLSFQSIVKTCLLCAAGGKRNAVSFVHLSGTTAF
jgi:hypothetical protein